jgi:hypothetical protein
LDLFIAKNQKKSTERSKEGRKQSCTIIDRGMWVARRMYRHVPPSTVIDYFDIIKPARPGQMPGVGTTEVAWLNMTHFAVSVKLFGLMAGPLGSLGRDYVKATNSVI